MLGDVDGMDASDFLILSTWFHSVVFGALIPNALVRARAGRGAVVGEPGWISDESAFALFIIGAVLAVVIHEIASGFLTSYLILASQYVPLLLANVFLVLLEYLLFKRLFLGRRITL